MEDYTPDSQTMDAAPDVTQPKTWDETISPLKTPGQYGTAFQSTNYISGSRGWKLNSNGIAEFSGIIVRDVLYTVPIGGDIQTAINTLDNAGGGTVQLQSGTYTLTSSIFLADGIKLVGAGRDSTIIEFSGTAAGIQCAGTSGNILQNWSIRDMTIQNSNNTACINVDYADFWTLENVRVYSCDQNGVKINRSQSYLLNRVTVESCTGNGFEVRSGATRHNLNGSFSYCQASSNGGTGFYIEDYNTSALVQGFNFLGCLSTSNTGKGIDIVSNINVGNGSFSFGSFIACQVDSNGSIGIDIGQYVSLVSFVGVFSAANTGDNIEVGGTSITFTGGGTVLGSAKNVDVLSTAVNVIFQGFLSPTLSSSSPSSEFTTAADKDLEISGVNSQSPRVIRKIYKMLNNTGSTITAGECVVFSGAGSTGEQISTTTTLGDDLIFGMAIADISTGNYGDILVEGYTELMKVNGTTDIASGDLLCSYTTAGIACKATTGDMAFAIALEAYTGNDNSGVINALIISPRKL